MVCSVNVVFGTDLEKEIDNVMAKEYEDPETQPLLTNS